jgi:hypothetical protein
MRRATVRTDHADARLAHAVSAAVSPDNTDEMDTRVDGTTVETTLTRETTGGLYATVDDYVVNVQVAAQLAHQPDATDASTNETTTPDR